MLILRRHHLEWIVRVLGTFPLVALTGARQVGKSTLARCVIDPIGGEYVSLDDVAALSEARADPAGFVRRSRLVVIDEVQLAPGLLPAIKVEIDRDRRAGRFLLTGSANLLRMRQVTESLAGRSAWLELPPLTWSELLERPRPATIDAAFEATGAHAFIDALAKAVPDHASQARQYLGSRCPWTERAGRRMCRARSWRPGSASRCRFPSVFAARRAEQR